MSIEMTLYLIDVIGVFCAFCGTFSLLFVTSTIILLCMRWDAYKKWHDAFSYLGSKYSDESSQRQEKREKEKLDKLVTYSHWSILFMVVMISLFIIIPSKKTMYMMLATNTAKKSEIPEKVLKAIEMKLDEYIDEVKGKVNK